MRTVRNTNSNSTKPAVMKYALKAITAIVLAEALVYYLQAKTEYWPMLPNAISWDGITYDTELWWNSYSPIIYLIFLVAALLPGIIANNINSLSPESTVLDDI